MKTIRIFLATIFTFVTILLNAQQAKEGDIFNIKKVTAHNKHYFIDLVLNDSVSTIGIISSTDTLAMAKDFYLKHINSFNMEINPSPNQLDSLRAGDIKKYYLKGKIKLGTNTYYYGPIIIAKEIAFNSTLVFPLSRIYNTTDSSRIIHINFPKKKLEVLSRKDLEKMPLRKFEKYSMRHGPKEHNYSIETTFYVANKIGFEKSMTGRFGFNIAYSGTVVLNTKRKNVFDFVFSLPRFEMFDFSNEERGLRYFGFLPYKSGICGVELGQITIGTLETDNQNICSNEFDGVIGTRFLGNYRCLFDFDKLDFYINL